MEKRKIEKLYQTDNDLRNYNSPKLTKYFNILADPSFMFKI